MNTTRLLVLANFLDAVPAEKFHLGNWRDTVMTIEADTSPPYMLLRKELDDDRLLDHACGTTACAVGWACVIPAFKEQGLHWDGDIAFIHGDVHEVGWDAAEEFFGLDSTESGKLFRYSSYERGNNGPRDVAARIREMVAA